MKFVMSWETRAGSSSKENLADIKDLLTIFGKWEGFPESVQVTEWVVSLAASGQGWLVCTTEDSDALMSAMNTFAPWLNFTLTPVIDVQPGVGVMAQSIDWVAAQL